MKLLKSALLGFGLIFAAAACGDDTIDDGTDTPGQEFNCGAAACTGDTICFNDACEAAFPRFYTVKIQSITFPQRKMNGECWDSPDCGAPDPEIEIRVDGEELASLEFTDNTYQATFDQTVDFQLIAGSALEIELEDEDLLDDETAIECRFEPITADILRAGDVSCTGEGAALRAQIFVRGGVPL